MSASSTMSESKTRFFRSSIDIPEDTHAQVVDLLNLRLADAIDLKMQAKHAHWNAKGKEFFALHQFRMSNRIVAPAVRFLPPKIPSGQDW